MKQMIDIRNSSPPPPFFQSVELGNRGNDHPPLYPMKDQTLPKTKPLTPADELTRSFVYTPPDTSNGQPGGEPVSGTPDPDSVDGKGQVESTGTAE